eukprot:jgi/Botrbrau1/2115/Bobra.0093s0022.1
MWFAVRKPLIPWFPRFHGLNFRLNAAELMMILQGLHPGRPVWLHLGRPVWLQPLRPSLAASGTPSLVHKIWRFSPLAFADIELEKAFSAAQASHGVDLGFHNVTLLGIVALFILSIMPEYESADLWVAYLMGTLSLTAAGIHLTCPNFVKENIQVVHGVYRIAVTLVGLQLQPQLMKPRESCPLTPLAFVQTYVMHPLVIETALLQFGAWQSYVPNLATSLVMTCLIVSYNLKYCSNLGSGADADVLLLSVFPKGLSLVSTAMVPAGITAWSISMLPSCPVNVAAFQVAGTLLTDIGLLVYEVMQRRDFLLTNAESLGPAVASRAQSWPLGDFRGVHACLLALLLHFLTTCVVWQTLLVFLS